jgi:hypothetical protein
MPLTIGLSEAAVVPYFCIKAKRPPGAASLIARRGIIHAECSDELSKASSRISVVSPRRSFGQGSGLRIATALPQKLALPWRNADRGRAFRRIQRDLRLPRGGVGMMMWMWISAIVILLGGELNAEIEHQTARDSTIGSEKPLGRRGA